MVLTIRVSTLIFLAMLVSCATSPDLPVEPDFYLDPPADGELLYGVGKSDEGSGDGARASAVQIAGDNLERHIEQSVLAVLSDRFPDADEDTSAQIALVAEELVYGLGNLRMIVPEELFESKDGTWYALVSISVDRLVFFAEAGYTDDTLTALGITAEELAVILKEGLSGEA